MRIIFCADPFQPSVPDSAYAAEAAAAEQAGFTVALIRYEALVEQQDELRATRRVVPGEQELAIYRGWMLRPEAYERLYHVLSEKGDYGNDALPLPLFCSIAQSVRSRFFTLDIARRHDGQWMIIEPGDGQVAGLPAKLEVVEFYRRLYSTVLSNA